MLYIEPEFIIKPPQLNERGGPIILMQISSIYTDKRYIKPVNTSFPNNSGVEISCFITSVGPKPLAVGNLPKGWYCKLNHLRELLPNPQ